MELSPFQTEYMETVRDQVATHALNYYANETGNQEAADALNDASPADNPIAYEAIQSYQEALFDNLQRIDDNEAVDASIDDYPLDTPDDFTDDEYTEYVNQHNENLREQISFELDSISSVKNYERIRENETDIDLTSGLADLSNSSQLGL